MQIQRTIRHLSKIVQELSEEEEEVGEKRGGKYIYSSLVVIKYLIF